MVKLKNYKYLALIITLCIYGCITKPEESDFALDSVIGRVVDMSSLPVSYAEITVQPGGHTAKTDANGYFEIRNISPGKYTALIEKNTAQEFIKQYIPINVQSGKINDFRINNISGFVFVDAKDKLGYNFYISKYELTRDEYYGSDPKYVNEGSRNCPWWEIMDYGDETAIPEYLNKKSIAEGLTPSYNLTGSSPSVNLNANGYRYPTVEEWMYAAKGGKYSKGYIYAGSNNIDEVAWYMGNAHGGLHPVGQKKPNELGIYDMNGNLWELCYGKIINPEVGEVRIVVNCGGDSASQISSVGIQSRYENTTGYRIVRIVR